MLKHTLESLELNEMESLSPVDEMLDIFINPPQRKQLHIVVQRLPSGELSINIAILSSILMAV